MTYTGITKYVLNELEVYWLSNLFAKSVGIKEIQERNAQDEITRTWHFDESGKLIRANHLSAPAWIATPPLAANQAQQVEFIHHYLDNGHIDYIEKIVHTEGNKVGTIHQFSYPSPGTVVQLYTINQGPSGQMEIRETNLLEQDKLREEQLSMKLFQDETTYSEILQKKLFSYNESDQLIFIDHSTEMKNDLLPEDEQLENEAITSRTVYVYDEKGRINSISTENASMPGSSLFNKLSFDYQEDSDNLHRCTVEHNSFNGIQTRIYQMHYNEMGQLSAVETDEHLLRYALIHY